MAPTQVAVVSRSYSISDQRLTPCCSAHSCSAHASTIVLGCLWPPTSWRRLAIGPRFTIPIARIDHDTLFPGHRAILVSGRDYMGFNRLTTPPAEG